MRQSGAAEVFGHGWSACVGPLQEFRHGAASGAQLKTLQEVITLTVFSVYSILYLGEPVKWNYLVGFGCITAGAFFVFHRW